MALGIDHRKAIFVVSRTLGFVLQERVVRGSQKNGLARNTAGIHRLFIFVCLGFTLALFVRERLFVCSKHILRTVGILSVAYGLSFLPCSSVFPRVQVLLHLLHLLAAECFLLCTVERFLGNEYFIQRCILVMGKRTGISHVLDHRVIRLIRI